MEIFTEIEPLRAFLNGKKANKASVGLVPTMGALHNGHLALIRASQAENSITVCSIYVNPAQFNNQQDLAKYPRTVPEDTQLLKDENCDVLFLPSNDEMYPEPPSIRFDFGELDTILEGKFRPGHFSGVALVVSKLFNIVQPDTAYFGQKDFQQFKVISQLQEELRFPIELRSVPIQREADGLALSSRNKRLNKDERRTALILFESLSMAKAKLQNGEAFQKVKQDVQQHFSKHSGARLEYFELADPQNLKILSDVIPQGKSILLIAAFVGEIRLIDNMWVDNK